MANGLETTHKVLLTLEVTGVGEAQRVFAKLGKATDQSAKAIGGAKKKAQGFEAGLTGVEKAWFKTSEAGRRGTSKWSSALSKLKTGLKEATGPVFKQMTMVSLLEKAVSSAVAAFQRLMTAAWDINRAYESAGSRIQGLVMGLTKFGDGVSQVEKVARSVKASNVIMGEFKDIALETASPIASIEEGYSRIASVVSGLGMNQKEIIGFTEKAAGAAKVYGERAGQAGSIVAKAIFEGVVEGESAFARAFKSQAQVTSKLPVEERIKRITKTLKAMAGPVETVTQDTQGALDRWSILSKDVLQKVTFPIYKKIGEVVAGVVGWMRRNEASINKVVDEVTEWWHVMFDIGKAVWDVVTGSIQIFASLYQVEAKAKAVWQRFRLIRQVIGLAATGVQLIVAGIEAVTNPGKGMAKFVALAEAARLKIMEMQRTFAKIARAFVELAIPEWMRRKIPGLQGFVDTLKSVESSWDATIDKQGRLLREKEKALGLGPLTETTRGLVKVEEGIGLSEKDREAFLKGLQGLKVQQNIGEVNIRQDFKDQDPDRVLIEFVNDLERLGEAAVQSSSAGALTQFEAGGY